MLYFRLKVAFDILSVCAFSLQHFQFDLACSDLVSELRILPLLLFDLTLLFINFQLKSELTLVLLFQFGLKLHHLALSYKQLVTVSKAFFLIKH